MDTNPPSLTRQAIAGIVKLAIALALLLFVPAGSVYFWQGWVFGLVFLASTLAITVYFLKHDPKLIERRLKAGPGAETERSQKTIQTFASVLFVLSVVIPALDHRFGWSTVPIVLVFAADLLVVLALLAIFFVFHENSYASATIEIMREQRVISTGPYRLVRHPMYSAALILFLAIPPSLGSWWGLLVVPPIVAVLAWRLLDEERLLVKDLPGYGAYQRLTRYRLVPFVW